MANTLPQPVGPYNSYCIPTIDVNKMDANNRTAEDLTPYYVHHFKKLEKLIRKRAKARSSIKLIKTCLNNGLYPTFFNIIL